MAREPPDAATVRIIALLALMSFETWSKWPSFKNTVALRFPHVKVASEQSNSYGAWAGLGTSTGLELGRDMKAWGPNPE